jgi:hypothetical protein
VKSFDSPYMAEYFRSGTHPSIPMIARLQTACIFIVFIDFDNIDILLSPINYITMQ